MDGSTYTGGNWETNGIPGTVTWDGALKEDAAYAVEQTSTGEIIICGSATTKLTPTDPYNRNVWVGKMNIDGYWISPFPKMYGSGAAGSNEIAYDIKESHDGLSYIVVGTANKPSILPSIQVPSDVHLDGDYYVLKIAPDGTFLDSKVFYDTNNQNPTKTCTDAARSITVDCNSPYSYVVTGTCKSCDPVVHDVNDAADKPNSEVYLLKIPSTNIQDEANTIRKINGNIDNSKKFDYYSYNLIQPYSGTFGTCSSTDGFFSTGLEHPGSFPCFTTTHDFWSFLTKNDLTNNTGFKTTCVNGVVDIETNPGLLGGGAYGGADNDIAWAAAQACDGILIAGTTKSSPVVQSCGACEVNCNHYNCTPLTEDIWLIKVDNSSNPAGALLWNESIGTSGNDGAYDLKRMTDGSYVMVGYTPNANGYSDFYVVKFELTATCPNPIGMAVTPLTYCATVSWTIDHCVPSYDLRYRKVGGAWTTITNVTSPYVITNTTNNGVSGFNWQVRANCSPGKSSAYSPGPNFAILYCNNNPVNCSTCLRLGSDDSENNGNNLLSVYPNPTEGNFKISLLLPDKTSQPATIKIVDQAELVVASFNVTIQEGKLEKDISADYLPSGFYLVRLFVDGIPYQAKLVKQ